MRRSIASLLFVCASGAATDFATVYNVKTYGAAGSGNTLDTAAVQKAIDAANGAGGGVVYFPAGKFLSGTITLKSNVTLYLSPGAVLLGQQANRRLQPQASDLREGRFQYRDRRRRRHRRTGRLVPG